MQEVPACDYLDETAAPTRAQIDAMDGLVLLEFGTEWCSHCRAIAPLVAQELRANPRIKHIKVEDGAGRPLGRSFHVKLWPTLVFLREGHAIEQLVRPGRRELLDAFAAFQASGGHGS